jgi:uncharacterized membrane protein
MNPLSNPLVMEWANLLVRWFHVIAGIAWIGQTYLFNRMERSWVKSKKPNIMGELWMVHGGGFYLVEKQKWPELMPRKLHWFKWESALTWLSGFLLLMIVYWAGAPLLEYGSDLSRAQGIGVSLAVLIGGWIGYNLIWRSPLGKYEPVGIAVSWAAVVALAWELTKVLSNRAAYLHIGAMFGTIMVCNVWMVILPNQRKMMKITKEGGKPIPELAARSARCSKHNTFMSVPVIFLMMSSHFSAATFGRDDGWMILGGLLLLGFAGAKLVRDYF